MTDTKNTNPFSAFSVDPAAFMRTLEGVRERAQELYEGASFPTLGLDLSTFTNALEELIQQVKEAYSSGSSSLPLDAAGLYQQVQERLQKLSNGASPLDMTAFSKTLQQIMTMNTDIVNAMSQTETVTELFNPGFWYKLSQETIRQTSDIMTGALRTNATPGPAPETREEQ